MTEMVTTAAAMIAPNRSTDTRRPVTSRAKTAKPGTMAMTPPKSLPQAVQPSRIAVTTPTTATAAMATRWRPARTSGSTPAAVTRSIPVANSANARLPKP